jgi:hypothetical protein
MHDCPYAVSVFKDAPTSLQNVALGTMSGRVEPPPAEKRGGQVSSESARYVWISWKLGLRDQFRSERNQAWAVDPLHVAPPLQQGGFGGHTVPVDQLAANPCNHMLCATSRIDCGELFASQPLLDSVGEDQATAVIPSSVRGLAEHSVLGLGPQELLQCA